MSAYFVSSATGWIAVILTTLEIVLPYLLRRVSLGQAPAVAERPPSTYLGRMWPHYWLGYLLVLPSLAHASAVMEGSLVRGNAGGIWAATSLLFLQVLLGVYCKVAAEGADDWSSDVTSGEC